MDVLSVETVGLVCMYSLSLQYERGRRANNFQAQKSMAYLGSNLHEKLNIQALVVTVLVTPGLLRLR